MEQFEHVGFSRGVLCIRNASVVVFNAFKATLSIRQHHFSLKVTMSNHQNGGKCTNLSSININSLENAGKQDAINLNSKKTPVHMHTCGRYQSMSARKDHPSSRPSLRAYFKDRQRCQGNKQADREHAGKNSALNFGSTLASHQASLGPSLQALVTFLPSRRVGKPAWQTFAPVFSPIPRRSATFGRIFRGILPR